MHIPGVFVALIVSQSCPLAPLWDRLGWRVQLLPTKLRWRETAAGGGIPTPKPSINTGMFWGESMK